MENSLLNNKLIHKCIIFIKWIRYFMINAVYLVLIPFIRRKIFKHNWHQMQDSFSKFAQAGLKTFNIESNLINPHDVNLKRQYIIASNHRSWFDQIAIMANYPHNVHFLAKKEYFDIPFFKYCLNSYEVVPVHKKTLILGSSKKLNHYIERGDSSVFFVEGTRGSGRKLLPFRNGAFKLAAKSALPVLPMYILGSEQCLSKKNSLTSVQSGNIVIIIGKPVYFKNENIEEQIKEFETRYIETHENLYHDYDKFMSLNENEGLSQVLGFGEV